MKNHLKQNQAQNETQVHALLWEGTLHIFDPLPLHMLVYVSTDGEKKKSGPEPVPFSWYIL